MRDEVQNAGAQNVPGSSVEGGYVEYYDLIIFHSCGNENFGDVGIRSK
jgi:hypothetical protein